MMTRSFVLLLVLCAGLAASDRQARAQGGCDRSCLEGIAEQYLDALVAKDPKKLPLAGTVKYTENGQRLQLGDGFWNSVTGRGTYKLHVTDVTLGQVATFTTMREAGTPVIIALRLKVDNRRLSEIETLIAHSENGAKNLEALGKPREAFLRPTAPADRVPRAELVRIDDL